MKSIGFIFSYLATPQARRNVRILGWMMVVFVVIVVIYSALFHEIMEREGQSHTWATAFYWTLVTMSTLGYGDIAFRSDLGRTFSVVVLLSGSVFILVLLPFTFIQFVFVPWMESSQRARAPRRIGKDVRGHVLMTGMGAVQAALVVRLRRAGVPYAVMVAEVDEALQLHDEGYEVLVGDLDDPEALAAAGVERARLVAALATDTANTNVAFTVREISREVSVVATAGDPEAVDILQLAGCDDVLQLGEMLGTALARRVLFPDGRAHVIGEMGDLLIAEAAPPEASVGVALTEWPIRRHTGLTVAGVWRRGVLRVARPTTVLSASDTLVLAGSQDQLGSYDERYGTERNMSGPVIVLGGGRVGRAAGRALAAAGVEHRIVEKQAERVAGIEHSIVGDAADRQVLEEAGIGHAPSVLITTHDDDVNVYLTIYCRRLRPDIQIIARARLDRNVTTLHRAGADAVLSYASTGANAIWNSLSGNDTLRLAEGLDVFRVPLPAELAGRPLRHAGVREATGCTVVATSADGHFQANPDVTVPLPPGADIVLIGDDESEDRFLSHYGSNGSRRSWLRRRPARRS